MSPSLVVLFLSSPLHLRISGGWRSLPPLSSSFSPQSPCSLRPLATTSTSAPLALRSSDQSRLRVYPSLPLYLGLYLFLNTKRKFSSTHWTSVRQSPLTAPVFGLTSPTSSVSSFVVHTRTIPLRMWCSSVPRK